MSIIKNGQVLEIQYSKILVKELCWLYGRLEVYKLYRSNSVKGGLSISFSLCSLSFFISHYFCPSLSLSVSVPLFLSVSLSLPFLSLSLSVPLYLCLCSSLSLTLSVSVSVTLCYYLSLSPAAFLCLCPSPYLCMNVIHTYI